MAPAWQQEELSRKTTMMHSHTAEQSIWPSVVKEKTSPIDRKMYKKPISVLTHEILTSNPFIPTFGFNSECQRITRLHQTSIEIN